MQVPRLMAREAESHKGNYGRVLIVAGSRGMSGAASLATYAAVRSGAGLVTAAVPDRILDTVAAFDPCFMTVPLADAAGQITAEATSEIDRLAQSATTIGIGPGLGQGDGVQAAVSSIYANFSGPVVVDADALNAMSKVPETLSKHAGPRILTPHIGEFRRLAGEPDLSPSDCRMKAKKFAADNEVILLLKGSKTLVTDGTNTYENTTGNAGMATGGCGDVLTGVITALSGQGYSPFEAAILGAYIHGMAGDLAAAECGEIGLTAIDVAESLPAAFCEHGAS
ncbi:MAG: NAD(P)H-hydrate dehydratase [Planctomycetaceae bacterium]